MSHHESPLILVVSIGPRLGFADQRRMFLLRIRATAAVRALNTGVNQSTDTIREKYVHLLRLDKRDDLT